MNAYKTLDFASARQRAFEHLSRFFTIRKRDDNSGNPPLQFESWLLELEINRPDGVMCLEVTVQLGPDFPLSLPGIYLAEGDVAKLGFPPNIDTCGLICTFDRNTNIPNPEAPERLVEICVRRAKSIIEDGLNNDNPAKYDKEFIAYWENRYYDETPVDTLVLSLVNETGELPSRINCALLNESIGNFRMLLYSDQQQFGTIQNYLQCHRITYQEIPTFYLGQLGDLYPPFRWRNGDVLRIIENIGLSEGFREYLKSGPRLPIVTFARTIDGRNLVFGWRHDPVEFESRLHRKKIVKTEKQLSPKHYPRLLAPKNHSNLVKRFSPQVFTYSRLIQRASADYSKPSPGKELKALIVGLGSVGSNLIPFLESAGVTEFRLVDFEKLSLENIGRHFLGINDVGRNKTEAVRDYLQKKNPLIIVQTQESGIVQLVLQEPSFLSDCDYYFFCTGDVNSEMWLAHNLHLNNWNRPAFFIWVEPYLAGGHCIYSNENDEVAWDTLFDDHKFIYNVISNQMHNTVDFTKREAGCQTTYVPYGASILKLFLAAIFPKIFDALTEKGKSRCFSWIGDLAALQNMDIKISRHAENVDSFSLLERPIC